MEIGFFECVSMSNTFFFLSQGRIIAYALHEMVPGTLPIFKICLGDGEVCGFKKKKWIPPFIISHSLLS